VFVLCPAKGDGKTGIKRRGIQIKARRKNGEKEVGVLGKRVRGGIGGR